jgi:hypothetical protein
MPTVRYSEEPLEYMRQWYQEKRRDTEWLAERKRKVNAQRRGKGYGRPKVNGVASAPKRGAKPKDAP